MLARFHRKMFLLLFTCCMLPVSLFCYWRFQPVFFPKEPGVTAWGAPIVWEGTFNRTIDDEMHRACGTVIGLSVFAVGKYLPRYLGHFLETAERHFMIGHPVVYYVLVDDISLVPKLPLAPRRTMVVTKIKKYARWQDVSMMRMRDIIELVVPRAQQEVNFLFCMDVDQEFTSHYGVEALGELVAQLHSARYMMWRIFFTYETNPASAAYIAPGEGDYYYHAATFGGVVPEVEKLARACLEGIEKDKNNGLEAIWHDESHLNRYLLHTKPTKLLSPEYNWGGYINVRYNRLRWMPKEYVVVRESQTLIHPTVGPEVSFVGN
ncbi:N-acetyllactosaminide alpha-1,3-galactosyltransferase-like isoform X2 [Ambystoma mexicanum]|uniref:N-acetyllactosaminide alpha-1,3-galactosyltransferase-like isoform X2 n=1 Tax=Ambystoma mexicanum TaxID=8296 RepID=UPI0037E99A17